jgi:rod shape-determining protein MreD
MFHVKQALELPGRAGRHRILGRPPPPLRDAVHRVGRGTQISYVGLLLAILIGILHAAVAPVIAIGDVHPNLVLVAVVAVTVAQGFGPGVAWAFVTGLTANLLTREPLGSIPLGLLIVVAVTAGGARLFGRLAWAYPVAAVAVGSLLVDGISLGVLLMVDPPLSRALPLARIAAAALLNLVIAAIVILPARLLVERAGFGEKPAW